MLASAGRSSGSTSGTGTASALTPILTPGDPLTDDADAAGSVSSSDESVSCDSVVVRLYLS